MPAKDMAFLGSKRGRIEFMGSDAASARSKILLVDDDQDFLEVYWEILKGIPVADILVAPQEVDAWLGLPDTLIPTRPPEATSAPR